MAHLLSKAAAYVLLATVLLSACGIEEGGLSPEERYTVDTLYVKELNTFRAKLDSVCKARNDTMYVRAVDSIKSVRMNEIRDLLIKNHTTQ